MMKHMIGTYHAVARQLVGTWYAFISVSMSSDILKEIILEWWGTSYHSRALADARCLWYDFFMQTNLPPSGVTENFPSSATIPDCSVSHCHIQANSKQPGAFCDKHYQKAYRGLDPEAFIVSDTGKNRAKCAFDDCEIRARRSGLCTKHHRSVMTDKLPAPDGITVKLSEFCAFETCADRANSYQAGALCQTHYVQKTRGIQLMPVENWGKYVRGEVECLVESCTTKAATRELCRSHYRMLKTYSLTPSELVKLKRNEKCQNAQCGSTERLCIDHDHVTGAVRGVLCGDCNTALGHAREDAARLRGLADYIESFA